MTPTPKHREETPDPARTPRRRYTRPVLTEYGSIAKLTQGSMSINSDGPGNTMQKMSCL